MAASADVILASFLSMGKPLSRHAWFRRLAAFYELAMDAAEGALFGFMSFVFVVWAWPFPAPGWAEDTTQLAWAIGFAGAGAVLGAVRSRLRQRHRRARGSEKED